MSLAERTAIIDEIGAMLARTGIRQSVLLSFLGLPRSTWNEWQTRKDDETSSNHDTPKSNWVTPEETKAVVDFCGLYRDRLRGYRYLAWLMVDLDVACVCPSTVYNILKRNNLFPKWATPTEAKKKGFDQPKAPNEQWHTDFSYVRVCGVFYYFACILDGFSRKIIVWDLFPTMESINIEILVARAKELHPDAHARIIHDNGRQFASRDFLDLVAKLELKETSTSPFHPQSNGKVERMHRTLKAEEVRRNAYFGIEDARKKMGRWVSFYNSERLHAAIGYLTPDEVFAGRMEERLAERRQKMYNATKSRVAYWKSQQAGRTPLLA